MLKIIIFKNLILERVECPIYTKYESNYAVTDVAS